MEKNLYWFNEYDNPALTPYDPSELSEQQRSEIENGGYLLPLYYAEYVEHVAFENAYNESIDRLVSLFEQIKSEFRLNSL